ncbi:hypothetical protein RvY_12054-2, partial [Ramazzottius varieornatus]
LPIFTSAVVERLVEALTFSIWGPHPQGTFSQTPRPAFRQENHVEMTGRQSSLLVVVELVTCIPCLGTTILPQGSSFSLLSSIQFWTTALPEHGRRRVRVSEIMKSQLVSSSEPFVWV